MCPAASTHEVTFLSVVTEHKCQRELTVVFIFPGRSTSRLYVLRPGGRWSVRSTSRGPSAGEPSLPIWTKPERWFHPNSTLGSLSTCAASLCVPDRTHTHTHAHAQQQKTSHQGDSRQNYKNEAIIAYNP